MGDISSQALAKLIVKYLDIEKLIKDNPSVTKEMINSFPYEISKTKKGDEQIDTRPTLNAIHQREKREFSELIIHTDGASRGNPGKAGIGVAIYDKSYRLVEEVCRFIGESTNNVAEYHAMILAVQKAIAYNAKKVTFKTDSELLVRQLNGIYRVKSPGLLPLYKELSIFLNKIPAWEIQHVSREENLRADALANKGIDSQSDMR